MKRLLTIDEGNYDEEMPVLEKHTVRAVIMRDGKFAMQLSGDGEYKIPGGGVEAGESNIETLVREVLEETGLVVKPESIRELGEILELREDIFKKGQKYVCHSYFYTCEVEKDACDTQMTQSEIAKGFHPVWEKAEVIIAANNSRKLCSYRDTRFMEMYSSCTK